MNSEETISLLAVNRITNYTPGQKYLLFEKFGSGAALFRHRKKAEALFAKTYKINGNPVDEVRVKKDAERDIQYCSQRGVEIIDIHSDLYPESLRAIDDPPIVLFAKGNASLLEQNRAVAMVGARKASNRSITMAYSIARFMARYCTVVSGLAAGIDYYVHKGSVEGGGATIAVLGNGIDVVYPKSNADMYESISSKGGLIISEYPVGTDPLKFHFPRRNRIISGLALGTVVVEASGNSGALITATFALEQGREVMALPGKAGSESFEGNNRLIREGAHLVESAEDILDILEIEYENPEAGVKKLPFSPLECNILRVIGDDSVSIEEIEGVLDDSIEQITSALTKLELSGTVVQHPGKIYSRVN